jgi:hypothetical protein
VIDELGERLGIGLVADMPGHKPREPGEARSGARLGHLLKAQIERVGQDRGEQQRAILLLLGGLEMGKHAAEVRPLVDFEQQIGDLDARQEMIGLISQRLSAVRRVILDRRNLEPPLGEDLLDIIIARDPGASHTDRILHALTIYGLTLVNENARGALSEFTAGRSRSGAALNRCLYEAVNVVGWHRDDARAVKEWAKLPIFAHREEVRKTGDCNTVPPGVKRDFERYTMEHPDLLKDDRTDSARSPRGSLKPRSATTMGAFVGSTRSTTTCRRCSRTLVCSAWKDLYEVSSANDWSIRERSLMAQPNARVLGIVPLLVLVSHFVAQRYWFPVDPAVRVDGAWNEARDEHNAWTTR